MRWQNVAFGYHPVLMVSGSPTADGNRIIDRVMAGACLVLNVGY